MVNLVYLTGGWLTQFTPTTEDEIAPGAVGEGRLWAEPELVEEWAELMEPEEGEEEEGEAEVVVCCLFMRMFSTVKLEMCLLLLLGGLLVRLWLGFEDATFAASTRVLLIGPSCHTGTGTVVVVVVVVGGAR